MSLSSVAGIIDSGGGLRVVVTQRWRIRHHVRKGERLFIVPDMLVQEPVPWDEIPAVINKAKLHLAKQMAAENSCGECRACCKTLYIDDAELYKPSHTMCSKCNHTLGCTIHHIKPKSCAAFACLWLKSQSRNDVMPPELRPDRCGVIFTDDTAGERGEISNRDLIEVHPDAHRRGVVDAPEVHAFISAMTKFGKRFKLITFYYGEKR